MTAKLVRATELCFVDNQLRQPGSVFSYDGPMPPKGGGPFGPADEEIVDAPRVERKKTKAGVAAPSWSSAGNKELGGQAAGE